MILEKKPWGLLFFAAASYFLFLVILYPLLLGLKPNIPKGYSIIISDLKPTGEARLKSPFPLEAQLDLMQPIKVKLFDRGEARYQNILIKGTAEDQSTAFLYAVEIENPTALPQTETVSGFIYIREPMEKTIFHSFFN